jgi:hypothetical protein
VATVVASLRLTGRLAAENQSLNPAADLGEVFS